MSAKLNLIDAKDVPEPNKPISRYYEIFEAIPKGKALVVKKHTASVRAALHSAQAAGKFKSFLVRQRKGVLYVINPDEGQGDNDSIAEDEAK